MVELKQEQLPLHVDRDGAIRVTGSRVTLDTIIGAYLQGGTPESISRQYSSLKLADIYIVLGYYLHHRAQVDAYLDARADRAWENQCVDDQRDGATALRQRLLTQLESLADDPGGDGTSITMYCVA